MFAIAAFLKRKKIKLVMKHFLVENSYLKNVETKKLYIIYYEAN